MEAPTPKFNIYRKKIIKQSIFSSASAVHARFHKYLIAIKICVVCEVIREMKIGNFSAICRRPIKPASESPPPSSHYRGDENKSSGKSVWIFVRLQHRDKRVIINNHGGKRIVKDSPSVVSDLRPRQTSKWCAWIRYKRSGSACIIRSYGARKTAAISRSRYVRSGLPSAWMCNHKKCDQE